MKKTMEMPMFRHYIPKRCNFWFYGVMLLVFFRFPLALAEPLELLALDFTTLPGDNLQVQLTLSGPAFSPRVFHTDNPARIALDLPGVSNALDKKQFPVNVGGAESIQAIAVADRTRVVINLTEASPYTTRVEGNLIFVVLQKGNSWGAAAEPMRKAPPPIPAPSFPSRVSQRPMADAYPMGQAITNVDFRRGEKGVGRILVSLSNPRMIADTREEGTKVIVGFPRASLPPNLARRLDVTDFATPVQFIDSMEDASGAKLVIIPVSGQEFEYSSYQSENMLTVEFRPLSRFEVEENKKKSFSFDGEKLSLNFQDIPVRSVLQILGDFTNLNIVASDTVAGNVTLRLNDVPWDQALDLVLKAKNLGKRQEGNIIQILPLDELNKQNKEELEQQRVVEELEPLKTEIIQINYTNAEEIKKVLLSTAEKSGQMSGQQSSIGGGSTLSTTTSFDVSQSILSARGNVTVDPRTNQLIVKDTSKNIERIRDLIKQLDISIRQVLVESRVVIANNNFARELGSRFAVNHIIASRPVVEGATVRTIPESGFFASGDALSDMGMTGLAGPGGVVGATVLKVGDYLLDLELSAAQKEGRIQIVSNPRVVTTDQTKAIVKQGTQVPVSSGSTATTVATITYKDIVLELNVTPHITPDDNIRMELMIKKDSENGKIYNGNPALDKRQIDTTVQVVNGETVVLGGVYEETKGNTTDKVPFFGDLPGIGFMFRRNQLSEEKKELLIFITPKILKQNLGQL